MKKLNWIKKKKKVTKIESCELTDFLIALAIGKEVVSILNELKKGSPATPPKKKGNNKKKVG